MNSQSVVILGAARSGTNILRDVLASYPGVGTWPCDEINYIWRHGHAGHPTDEFTADMATPRVTSYIRRAFERESRRQHLRMIVEKTCANTLRVPFVNRILPEARFVYILRDGIDVVASARERWVSRLDLRYTVRKARYVPFSDIPRYAFLHSSNRVRQLFSKDKRMAYWGPRFDGIDAALEESSVEEVCALQWLRCVEAAERDLTLMPESRVIRVRYEDFAVAPKREMERIASFLGLSGGPSGEDLARTVSAGSVGRGRRALGPEQLTRVLGILGEALESRGYDPRAIE